MASSTVAIADRNDDRCWHGARWPPVAVDRAIKFWFFGDTAILVRTIDPADIQHEKPMSPRPERPGVFQETASLFCVVP